MDRHRNDASMGCLFPHSGCPLKRTTQARASTLQVVQLTNHFGGGCPPGQVWPPPSTVLEHTRRVVLSWCKRGELSGATSVQPGSRHRFLGPLAAQFGCSTRPGDTHVEPPLYGTSDRLCHETRSSEPVEGRCTSPRECLRRCHHPDRRDSSDSVQESANDMPPPFESPLA